MSIRNQRILTFISALGLISMAGSLYFSLYKGLFVCDLCWYQRICMYPIGFLAFISLFLKDDKIRYHIRLLSLVGFAIASYHVYIQFFSTPSPFCAVGRDCTEIQVQYFGFLTIPLMSFISFFFIAVSTFFIKKEK
ncbi:disulfide bond formation protein B [Bacillus sp. M6-12]|uniref:disulfide bond formation protein B n=1 Tax=Bacillus sp. M6-12 TaxID=2054166 RepID=UPI000C75EB19|nr:disulfide bond formation protein B [Bacillus sp. M6-12]PLS19515.1 disulfide bond formation protein B [Bacillus sp. M6-12]